MTGSNYTYPDKLGYGETLMFHIRCMSSELANDGLDNEFEDMVDMLGWLVWPYFKDGDRQAWEQAAKDGLDVPKGQDPLEWGRAKRRRVEAKMTLAMTTLETNGLLLKKVQEFDPEFHYRDIPVEGGD